MSKKELPENELPSAETTVAATTDAAPSDAAPSQKKVWLLTVAAIGLVVLLGVGWIAFKKSGGTGESATAEKTEAGHGDAHGAAEAAQEVKLDAEAQKAANLEMEGVTTRPAIALLRVTGTVEANPQQNQSVTSLVSGRIEQVSVSIGDRVAAGQTIATLVSNEIAESYGKWREAETRVALAQQNLARVQSAANRVAVLQAKARLDEAANNRTRTNELVKLNASRDVPAAEAALNTAQARYNEAAAALTRTKKIVELGAGAGKDLIAAETAHQTAQAELEVARNNVQKIRDFIRISASREVQAAETVYQTAKAEYEFQRDITLTKEFQEANSELRIAQVDALHQKQSLEALGVNVRNINDNVSSIARVPLRATLSGLVTERLVSNGSGVQAGQEILKLSNVSSVWITANVPEKQLRMIQVGTPAEIKIAALGPNALNARVTSIDTTLNEDTRTAKVRLAVDNPGEKLRAGMFAEIGFRAGGDVGDGGAELVVRSAAIQRVNGQEVVFVPVKDEPGAFEIREIKTDGESDGYTRITDGLKLGETVVAQGSFALKTQLEKGAVGDEH